MTTLRLFILFGSLSLLGTGCLGRHHTIDQGFAREALLGLNSSVSLSAANFQDEGFWDRVDEKYEGEEVVREPGGKSVILGELLAFFPGLFVHGLGHYYAGDYQTAKKINKIGQWGYLLTAVGGGLITGAYYLDDSSEHILPISLYVTGGGVGAVGLTYFFTAWISDMWDVPRAIRTGGEPWEFMEENALLFE